MRLYLAGYEESHVRDFLSEERKKQIRILFSYYYMTGTTLKKLSEQTHAGDVFLDSGAFSAFTKGAIIDIDEYCSFILDNIDHFTTIAGLDVIGDDVASMANQKYMEEQWGIDALPCFHYGEDFSYLDKYIEKYDYIAIGGLIAAGNKNIKPFLDKVFSEHICDSKGRPRVKVHGFAMTSPVLMVRYPWYSVDSSSWNYGARNCFIYMPKKIKGKWDYTKKPTPYVLSTARTEEIRQHRPGEWEQMLEYFDYVGMDTGESHIKRVTDPKNYQLKENEQWSVRKYSGFVEVVERPGVLTDPRARNVLNVIYFQEIEKHIQENPVVFKKENKRQESFGL